VIILSDLLDFIAYYEGTL